MLRILLEIYMCCRGRYIFVFYEIVRLEKFFKEYDFFLKDVIFFKLIY